MWLSNKAIVLSYSYFFSNFHQNCWNDYFVFMKKLSQLTFWCYPWIISVNCILKVHSQVWDNIWQLKALQKWWKIFQGSIFQLTYHDSGNMIHFTFFMMKFFPPSLEITIPKHNTKKQKHFFLNTEIKLILMLALEKILIPMCHVLWAQFCCSCIYTKTERNRSLLFKEIT